MKSDVNQTVQNITLSTPCSSQDMIVQKPQLFYKNILAKSGAHGINSAERLFRKNNNINLFIQLITYFRISK